MEEDAAFRRRLKKKFLDRWENEGGRLGDELTRTLVSGTLPKDARKVAGVSAAETESPPVTKSQASKK